MFYIFILITILVLLYFWQASTLISIYGGSPYVASKKNIIKEALKLAEIKSDDVFYELGSGLGTGLIIASREFGAKAIGIEISPYNYLVSKIRTNRNKKIRVIMANIKRIDLSEADVVYCYLYPKLMDQLLPKFKNELKPGSRVVSAAFTISKLKPDIIKEIDNKKIYMYRF